MIGRILQHALEPIIRALIVISVLGFAIQVFILDTPYVYISVEVVTPQVVAGQPVSIIYVREKKRSCSATIHQFIVRESTGEAIWRQVVPGGYGVNGTASVRVRLPTLPEWEPGGYIYQPTMQQECGWVDFTIPIPPARFEIVKSGDVR